MPVLLMLLAFGLGMVAGPLWGEVPERVEFHEDDLTLHFAPMDAQKTGFFLDQRDNRRMLAALVQPGQHFLDVYSYTGGFSLHAAKAGAKSVAVDKDQVAVGAGRMPIREVIAAARNLEAGVVELDDFNGDIFDAVGESLAYLKEGK